MSEQKNLIVKFYRAHDLAHIIANHEKLLYALNLAPAIKETLIKDVKEIKRILNDAKLEGEK